MSEWKHGAFSNMVTDGAKAAAKAQSAMIYIGTAPVHLVAGGAELVNKPIVVSSMNEARKKMGYSEDWAKYTLCEAMYAHLEYAGVGPLVLINVLDPAKHKANEGGSISATPAFGKITITDAGDIIIDSITVTGKTPGTDYSVSYDCAKEIITIAELTSGALGSQALDISWDKIDASKVSSEDVIGSSDGEGLNTGIYAIRNVYQTTGYIPSTMLCPGFSSDPEVHKAMVENSLKVNGHWSVHLRTDLPLSDGGTPLKLSTAAAWKKNNGYNQLHETPYFPLAKGTDGRIYHHSVLAAANLQKLLIEQSGIPYASPSNTECSIIQNLYLGEENEDRVYDDEIINRLLNQHGIASSAFVSGRWAIWGSASGEYEPDNATDFNVFETNVMMLFYLTNDFQHRRGKDVDKPTTVNDLKSIAAEEQARLDALISIGALTAGEVILSSERISRSDIVKGDYCFSFRVSTMPLGKSLTADIYWTTDGYQAYYEAFGV